MKFYIDEDDACKLQQVGKNKTELECLCAWNHWNEGIKNYEVTFKIKNIDKKPFLQKLRSIWNNFVKRFMI